MRRCGLSERNGIFYAQLFNPKTHTFMTAKSTGKRKRDEAAGVATDWLKNGLPSKKRGKEPSIDIVMTLDAVLSGLQTLPVLPDDISRVIEVMKNGQFIENAVVRSCTGGSTSVKGKGLVK